MSFIPERDSTGRAINRSAIAIKGATYCGYGFEFFTSTLASVTCKKIEFTEAGIPYENDCASIPGIKLYNASKVEITTAPNETNCVLTCIEFELPDEDYEVLGGTIYMDNTPLNDFKVYVVGVPDVPAGSGGRKQMVRMINMKTVGKKYIVDGRASKAMVFEPTYHTSKLGFYIAHNAGVSEKVHIILDIFRT